jgi:hypothetical protein
MSTVFCRPSISLLFCLKNERENVGIIQRLFGRNGPGTVSKQDYTEPRSGLVFPMELGGLKRLAVGRPYAEGGRAGESIPYGCHTAQAAIYVTTVQLADFPDGGESDFIREEVESAMAAVREMERIGRYQKVKYFSADPQMLGKTPGNLVWGRSAFFTINSGRPMMSLTYITALGSLVIKLRLSCPSPDDKSMIEFPNALGDLISGQR